MQFYIMLKMNQNGQVIQIQNNPKLLTLVGCKMMVISLYMIAMINQNGQVNEKQMGNLVNYKLYIKFIIKNK